MLRRPRLALCFLTASLAAPACSPQAPTHCPTAIVPGSATPPGTATPPTPTPAVVVSGYDKPPQNILDVLHAPAPPEPNLSPTRDNILLVSWVEYPSITRVAEPFLGLAGVRIEPKSRRKHDTHGGYGINPCARSFSLVRVADGHETKVTIPEGGCVDGATWAADGKHFAFRNATDEAVELWVGDAASGEVHRVPSVKLNPMLGYTMQWMPDQASLVVKLVVDGQGPPPPSSAAAISPSIQETKGQKGESSTYEARDTLSNPRDEDLFDYYASSQIGVVDIATGAVARLGAPGIYYQIEVSPDAHHVLVSQIKKPYSYVTTFERFPYDVLLWDRDGKLEKTVASLPLADRVPIHGVPTGPRDFDWRANEPATLVWDEALDGGDWNVKVPARDKVMMQRAPFKDAPIEITRTEQRFTGLEWGEQKSLAILQEYDENKHWRQAFTLDVDAPSPKPRLLWDLSSDEHYADPGSPVMRVLPNGEWVVRQSGDAIFLRGSGASPDGDRPFLDKLDLGTRASTRLFRSDKTALESALAFTDDSLKSFITWHQTPTDPPNAFVRTFGDAVAKPAAGEATVASTTRAVTHIPDPTPAVRSIKKRLVKYKRKDGTDLSFTLYTPPDYKEGTRLPAILYAYPLDYADVSKAGQVTGSQETFTRLSNYKLLLLDGYAIIDNAAFPIVGDPKKAYDTYLDQLVADAQAAVDQAVSLGVVDRDRIGVTGHSHGALMTVNLVAHSDLFRAGVATSGSYNKTLTPFGFQNERRSVWEAEKVYLDVSPFFVADKIKLPLLIMHGTDDANPGTTPLQATKLFEAIRGNGGTTRLVMLPHEPHWYAAMESNEQLLAEMTKWFDQYVKNAGPRDTPKADTKPKPH